MSTGSVGGRLTIDGLQNGTSYAVAVGATDPYLNVGELSPLQCATPVLLDSANALALEFAQRQQELLGAVPAVRGQAFDDGTGDLADESHGGGLTRCSRRP